MNKYHFPPTKKNQLVTLKNWINYVEGNDLTQNWDEFATQLP
jgi:hypothetical protein